MQEIPSLRRPAPEKTNHRSVRCQSIKENESNYQRGRSVRESHHLFLTTAPSKFPILLSSCHSNVPSNYPTSLCHCQLLDSKSRAPPLRVQCFIDFVQMLKVAVVLYHGGLLHKQLLFCVYLFARQAVWSRLIALCSREDRRQGDVLHRDQSLRCTKGRKGTFIPVAFQSYIYANNCFHPMCTMGGNEYTASYM